MEKHLREDDENACASLERVAGTNGYGRYGLRSLLKIDTGKWYCASRGAVSIKVHRGPLFVCENLINTKVSFIRPRSCSFFSYITSRAGNKKGILGRHLKTSGLHADSELHMQMQAVHLEVKIYCHTVY